MEQPRRWTWRDRAEGSIRRGTELDPTVEQIDGIRAYPTAYLPENLLVSMPVDGPNEAYEEEIRMLRDAAGSFGWRLEVPGSPHDALRSQRAADLAAQQRSADRMRGAHRELLPGVAGFVRAQLTTPDEVVRGESPVPPDAWRVLQRARRISGSTMPRTSLEHVLSIDPVGLNPFTRTNPFTRSNPFTRRNPVQGEAGSEDYLQPGRGARQPVAWLGPAPKRSRDPKRGRRAVIAMLDTGCGVHEWLPDDIVTRRVELDGVPIGLTNDADPERYPDLYGQLDGEIDPVAGHGTFIAGLLRQAAPDADILSVRVANALGVVDESAFLHSLAQLIELLRRYREDPSTGHPIDVISLSLGYYHETPEDGLFSRTLYDLLRVARELGCIVVCSSGNDAIDRPAFPASLWAWPGADNGIPDDDAAPLISVGAANPSAHSVALFSNVGPWVQAYAVGAAVVSTTPAFTGGNQSRTRADVHGLRRETLDPDDYRGGFATWSGTSFAAPYVAGLIAAALGPLLEVDGVSTDAAAQVARKIVASLPAEALRA